MIRILYSSPRTPLDVNYPLEKLHAALRNKKGVLWLDLSGEPNQTCEPILLDVFGFHPLAVDDALQETHTPKVDDWGEYIYIVLNAMNFDASDGLALSTTELDIFLGPNYVVTHHDRPIAALEKVSEAFGRDKRYTAQGPDHLLYKIIDSLVADYMPIVEAIDDQIDRVEDEVLTKAAPDTLERIFSLKRILLAMRRVIAPQREVLNKLARDDYEVIDQHDRIFFRDVYDHLVRLHDLNESMRDLVSGALDTYLSVINNRMNDVMKTLTIITTLFMPISFLTGFFGMNFFQPAADFGNWTNQPAFLFVMGIFILLPISMYLWMKRRTWV